MVAARREQPLKEGRALRALQQLGPGQAALVARGVEVEGDAFVGGPVQGLVPGEESVVRRFGGTARIDQVRERARLALRVQLPDVPAHPRQEQ